jgi:capsular polysaccharide biosynthesis protein
MNTGEGALEQALRVLRRRKVIILVAIISVPLAAFLVSSSKTKMYTASATLLFESKTEAGLSEATREAATNEALAALPAVAAKAAKQLGPETNISEIFGSVEVASANEMANVATISATNESPERAAEIANAYSQAYIEFRREASQSQLKQSIAVIEARLADLAPNEAGTSKANALNEQLSKLEVEEQRHHRPPARAGARLRPGGPGRALRSPGALGRGARGTVRPADHRPHPQHQSVQTRQRRADAAGARGGGVPDAADEPPLPQREP